MKKNIINGFTLIEIIVVIFIMGILALGLNFLNVNKASNTQKLNIKIIQIVSQIEKIRNNSLLWKSIWVDLFVPERYKIDFSTSWSWIIKTQYFSWSYLDYNFYDKNIQFWNNFDSISEIRCLNLDKTAINIFSPAIVWTWTIIIEWSKIFLSWDCNDSTKILEISVQMKSYTKKFHINTLNWLIEIIR